MSTIIFDLKHIKSFAEFIAEEYNHTLRSDPEIKIHKSSEGLDDSEPTILPKALQPPEEDEDLEPDVLDREFSEPSYLDAYRSSNEEE